MEGTLDAAVELGLPIWSAEEWLRFTAARRAARFEKVEWDSTGKRLDVQLADLSGAEARLTVLVPFHHNDLQASRAEVDGASAPITDRTVGGVTYAAMQVSAQSHRITVRYQ